MFKPLKNINWESLQDLVEAYVDGIEFDGTGCYWSENIKDAENQIYETALIAVYGDNIFEQLEEQDEKFNEEEICKCCGQTIEDYK